MANKFDLDIMALTLYGECRGEPLAGQTGVAWVIKNRWLHPGWWSRNRDGINDDTIAAVCLDPWQFSCWNPSDPNRKKLDDPATLTLPIVVKLRELASQVLESEIDVTNGADHYCTKAVAKSTKWAKGRKPVKVIGNHHFYKLLENGT